ncbi:MAG: NADH-quinone oxidoreductase subunit L, partial [Armatimonadota bacterium]
MAHEQDMRRYGRLAKYLPLTMATMLIGTLAISGVPLFSGGYSKEAILVSAFATSQAQLDGVHIAMGAGWVGLFTALLTAAYMARLMMLTFFGDRERWRDLAPIHEDALAENHHEALAPNHRPHEVGFAMAIPLVVLAVLSVFGGIVLEQGERFRHFISPGVGVVITENTGTVPVVA